MGTKMVRLKLLPSISNFVQVVSGESQGTGTSYAHRMNMFNTFLLDKYSVDVDKLIIGINKKKFDVYDILTQYRMFLQSRNNAKSTVINCMSVAKVFLEYSDINISNVIYKLKVRPGKRRKVELQALSKEDIRKILLGCQDVRLLSYCLLLASSGMRANEATSIRLQDIDFESGTVQLREEFTKTKQARTVFLTQECVKQLKLWKEHRERVRRIVNPSTHKITKVTRTFREDELFFSSGKFQEVEEHKYLYVSLTMLFSRTLDRVGFVKRRENLGNQHTITLHSLRRYVKTTISDLGYQDFSEYFIGHSGSTYWRKPEKEKLEIFHKVEPYLTYLDYSELEAHGADTQTQLEANQKLIDDLRRQLEQQKTELKEDLEQFKKNVAKRLGLSN